MGADAPSDLYFNTEEKARAFLENQDNGEIRHVDVQSKYPLNYSDGCTMNDMTFGNFDAVEIHLQEPGWITTECLGDVYVDEYRKVIRSVMDGRTIYPYRASKSGGWDNCSGSYIPAYLAKLMNEGKAKWA